MPLIPVADPGDPRLRDYVALTDVALRSRHEPESGMYIAESAEVIRRAVAAGHRPRSMVMQDTWVDRLADLIDEMAIDVYVGSKDVLERLTGFHVHRGALAAMHRPELPHLDSVIANAHRVVIVEDLVDHTNVGAIFRSAAGLGMDAVLVTPRCADPLYRRSVRVSMGSVFAVPWTRIDPWPGSLAVLRGHGFTIAAVTPRGPATIPLTDFASHAPARIALVLGTEGDGLSAPALDDADVTISIPMQGGVDSLNVAAASAVVFWALATPKPAPPAPGS